jgi:thiol-disulfide isomerase/thioredoxin
MVSLHAAVAAILLSNPGDVVLLDFYADWCAPCRAMTSTVDALAAKGYPVRKVNFDRDKALVQQFGVTSIPCFIVVANGREVERVTGGTTLYKLENMCKAALAQAGAQPAGPPAGAPTGSLDSMLAAPPRGPLNVMPASTPVGVPFGDKGDSPIFAGAKIGTVPEARIGTVPGSADDPLLAASVRLRIEDARGRSCGSGTIIDTRGSDALILTCGHIFRDSQGKGRIEVDLFGPGAAQKIPGELVAYDLESDVGLVAIRAPGPVTVARVAPAGFRVGQGEPVISVGCNNGNDPSVMRSRVLSINRCEGPANLQVAGRPVDGRSGGGLFTDDGLVVGVCNAAGPGEREGFYAALPSIHALLDRKNLASVYAKPGEKAVAQHNDPARRSLPPIEPPPAARPLPPVGDVAETLPGRGVAPLESVSAPLTKAEQATLDEIRRRAQEGSEVVVVIRSRRDPQARSEVLVLDQASPNFLKQLAADALPRNVRHLTSLDTPKNAPAAGNNAARPPLEPVRRPSDEPKPRVLLEWKRGK